MRATQVKPAEAVKVELRFDLKFCECVNWVARIRGP